ncbi:DUF1996 domain-containing protein [Streptomyces sp. 5-8]|uniref:DUF1996 domain-containing protein n=1 Tax=Streptomyces musisoli TaxID=2802280 RepID=A0ABS1NVK4_9ACTN|nr:DUF1996 domain-containing protein [Streptomyces musisoli]MBL1104136.1 DUF1996 domain-containing protein [Streptomyces musisoli]
MLGGAGLVAANVYASASEGWGDGSGTDSAAHVLSTGMPTIDCPDVGSRLTAVPDAARSDVDRELALLDQQTAESYRQLQQWSRDGGRDGDSADDTIMNPLEEKRSASLGRIGDAIDRAGERPQGLDDLAPCTLRPGDSAQPTAAPSDGTQPGDGQGQGQNGQGQGQGQGGAGQGGNGPVVSDYVDITGVQPDAQAPPPQADASRGTFTSDCGVNANGLFNSDNVIVAPGVSNGAHHFHDYVGNQSNTAFASDEDLANADTSCVDQGDKSTYYWPVLRLQNGTQERDAGAPGGGTEGNAGQIVTPKEVTLTFVGNPRGQVTAMPRLLRIITGDAKAFVNGPGNANASWSCTGFEDRQLKDKYPLCPQGSDVVRTFRFQSCWDGRNIDSANHRTHVAFAAQDGSCPAGFQPIPQLVQRIVYDVPAPSVADGGRTVPLFAVDSFPEQLHKPVTDHGDFINVFDEDLMREMVDCINSGRTCGPDAAGGGGNGDGSGGNGDGSGGNTGTGDGSGGNTGDVSGGNTGDAGGNGGDAGTNGGDGTGNGDDTGTGNGDNGGTGTGNGDDAGTGTSTGTGDGSGTGDHTGSGTGATEETGEPGGNVTSAPAPTAYRPAEAPRTDATTSQGRTTKHHSADKRESSDRPVPVKSAGTAPTSAPSAPAGSASAAAEGGAGDTGGPAAQAGAETQAQATQGGLAETGAQLWPAAIGTLLALSGLFMLLRARRMRY